MCTSPSWLRDLKISPVVIGSICWPSLKCVLRMPPQHTITISGGMIRLTTFSAGSPVPSYWCKLGSCPLVGKLWRAQLLLQVRRKRCASCVDPARRPGRARDPVPRALLEHVPDRPLTLDEQKFAQVLRSSRRGAAAGPSGMTADHLRIILDRLKDTHLLFTMGEQMARANLPDSIVCAVRLGRMTALQKPSGGIRGIVAVTFCAELWGGRLRRKSVQQWRALQHHFSVPCPHGLALSVWHTRWRL